MWGVAECTKIFHCVQNFSQTNSRGASINHRYNNTGIGNFRVTSQISMGSTSIGIGAARSLNFRGSFALTMSVNGGLCVPPDRSSDTLET